MPGERPYIDSPYDRLPGDIDGAVGAGEEFLGELDPEDLAEHPDFRDNQTDRLDAIRWGGPAVGGAVMTPEAVRDAIDKTAGDGV